MRKGLQVDDKFCLECGTKVIDEDSIENGLQEENPEYVEKKSTPPPVMQIKNNNKSAKPDRNVKNLTNISEGVSGNLVKKILSTKILLYIFGGFVIIVFVLFMVFKESNEQNKNPPPSTPNPKTNC